MDPSAGTSASPQVVLVVEDDPDVASAIGTLLESEGFRTVIAATVADATTQARLVHPSLVLLDWNLPDGCGEDVVRAIRPDDPSVPIIVMSGARDALQASLRVDARERLAKPFDLERLVGLVRSYLV
jgi:two-component system, OmpR family, response regulator